MSCPALDCTAALPEQRDVTAGQRESMGNPEWGGRAQRCSYCGCVHTREAQGRTEIRGWLDNSLAGPDWRPSRNA